MAPQPCRFPPKVQFPQSEPGYDLLMLSRLSLANPSPRAQNRVVTTEEATDDDDSHGRRRRAGARRACSGHFLERRI